MSTEFPILDVQAELAAEITAIRFIEAQESSDISLVRIAAIRHVLACGFAVEMDHSIERDDTLGAMAKKRFNRTLIEADSDSVLVDTPRRLLLTDLWQLPEDTPGLVERGKTRSIDPGKFIVGILKDNEVLLQEIITSPLSQKHV